MLNRPLFISLKIMLLLVLLLVEILFDFFTACLISSHGQHNCYQLSFKLLSAFIHQLSFLPNIIFQLELSADILIYW